MKKWIVVGIFLFCLSISLVSGEDSENKTQNILLSTNLEKNHYLNINFDHLFAVDKQTDCSEKDKVTVLYNVSKNNALIKEESFTRDLNSCTKVSASTGDFTPVEVGNYTLCGVIVNSTVGENNSFYDQVCNSFEVLDTLTISCGISMQLKTNETIFYENGQSLKFTPELNNGSFPYVIEYWIEDLFGKIVKPKINTTNTNQKSWKTSIQEQDRVLFLKAAVYPGCDDLDFSNNAVEKMFIVTNSEVETKSSSAEKTSREENLTTASAVDSTIKLIKISPETVSFGTAANTELEIYKGATDKYSVSVWAEKDGKIISEKTKVHLKTKNTLFKFTVPVLIGPNCDGKIKDGDAQLIVEGLGSQEEKEFTLAGTNKKLCPEKDGQKSEKKSTKTEDAKKQIKTTNQSLSWLSQSDLSQSLATLEKAQKKEVPGYQGMIIYESVSESSKNLIPWVLFIAFGLLSLVLVIKRGNT
ncbi:MAG: hypothetical protein Q8R47_06480 [Nanoarchaeota archaeon]|nr:hypothetical protein [Nanoarchaeota archaeon]